MEDALPPLAHMAAVVWLMAAHAKGFLPGRGLTMPTTAHIIVD